MSKNFELMQQAANSTEVRPTRPVVPTIPPIITNGVHRDAESALDLGQLASEEALRLVQRIFLLQSEEPPRAVVFAGVDRGNGCSEICVQVADTLAKNIKGSVCLVEANLRAPRLPGTFGTTNHHGLTESLLQEGPVRTFAKPVRGENLWLLSSGSLATDSPKLLHTKGLRERFAELRQEFDFVIVDAPPLTPYSDAIGLGQMADGFVLVLEANSTRREAALKASENLRAANINVLGAVLNKRTFPIPDSLYHKL